MNLINETNYSVMIEALGEDEKGTDILVTYSNGIKEYWIVNTFSDNFFKGMFFKFFWC